jgi:uncharacterized Rmd1/YagE family protein
MSNPIEMIYEFNKDRGLLDAGYSDQRECAFPIEEALEGFGDRFLEDLRYRLEANGNSPKSLSRAIVAEGPDKDIAPVDRLDKHLDIIVFSFGSIFKMGLNPKQALEALTIVMEANMTKSNQQDSTGKNLKGDNFIPPEKRLEALLNQI